MAACHFLMVNDGLVGGSAGGCVGSDTHGMVMMVIIMVVVSIDIDEALFEVGRS